MEKVFSTFEFFGVVGELIPGMILVAWLAMVHAAPLPAGGVPLGVGVLVGLVYLAVAFAAGSVLSSLANSAVVRTIGEDFFFQPFAQTAPSEKARRFVRRVDGSRVFPFLTGVAARARLYGTAVGVMAVIGCDAVLEAIGVNQWSRGAPFGPVPTVLLAALLGAVCFQLSRCWWRYYGVLCEAADEMLDGRGGRADDTAAGFAGA